MSSQLEAEKILEQIELVTLEIQNKLDLEDLSNIQALIEKRFFFIREFFSTYSHQLSSSSFQEYVAKIEVITEAIINKIQAHQSNLRDYIRNQDNLKNYNI